MALLTESGVREALTGADLADTREYRVPDGTVVTPAARAWLVDQRIELVVGEKRQAGLPLRGEEPARRRVESAPLGSPSAGSGSARIERFRAEQGLSAASAAPTKPAAPAPVSALPAFVKPDHFELPDGSTVTEKPEHLTALVGNALVEKDHPNIRLRGQLDAFGAQLVLAQTVLRRLKLERGVADLASILQQVRLIMRAEVLGVRLEECAVLGMTQDEIRAASHDPSPIFGIPHFLTQVEDGEAVATLNVLRTKVREVELAAYDAFKRPDQPPRRADILRCLNRLSSAIYVMMLKAKTGRYAK